ncbi:glycosyltransferase family 4 protein [Vibrio crassostreae]|uniref:glycosyltransferase family 4 protein n=1 Tax=Vibrio crassostreae TaxID=246167 RepID=UPI00104DF03C|nr:glycosyltransferase family 4 protein [Vibrio crassostreae]TCW16954.1 glycosyltransferase involved in cell wall biosynthesis [Vibrio crassostreae]CAK3667313.1 Glycosyltransferase [Vibrio crassostreae]
MFRKVNYIASSKIPSRAANSIHVMKMCNSFSKVLPEVTLLVPDYKGLETLESSPYEYYGVDDGFNIVRCYIPDRVPAKSFVFGVIAAIKTAFERKSINYCRSLSGAFFSAILGKYTVFESHHPVVYYGRFHHYIFKLLVKLPRFKKLVVISDSLKEYYLCNYNMVSDDLMVMHDGSDIPNYTDEAKSRLCSNYPNFLAPRIKVGYIGHLYKGRGIEIIRDLSEFFPSVDFHLIGGNEKDIKFWRDKLREQENLFVHGFVSPVNTQILRGECDILIAPYQRRVSVSDSNIDTSKWMSPLKVFEYMSSNVAIISSDLPVLREILIDNENCLLCTPDDLEQWKNALSLLIKSSEIRAKLASNAYQLFMKKYTWDKRAESILNKL